MGPASCPLCGETYGCGSLLSAKGLGCVKTPAATARLEQLARAALYESEFMLREHAPYLAWRIVFSTSFGCNSFHTARVKDVRTALDRSASDFRFAPKATELLHRQPRSRGANRRHHNGCTHQRLQRSEFHSTLVLLRYDNCNLICSQKRYRPGRIIEKRCWTSLWRPARTTQHQ
jgi:hypothetical protein